jgi:peptide/nickel transport system permease protein
MLCALFVGAPMAANVLGHGPDVPNFGAVRQPAQDPVGLFTRVPESLNPSTHTIYLLGADGPLGRDEFLRVLYGGQVSLEIGFGAALLAVVIGGLLGAIGGFFGGLADALISRLTDLVMAVPLILVLIVLGSTVGESLVGITFGGAVKPGVFGLTLLIGAFTWFYPARIARSQAIALRHREFVEAATMVGASRWSILRHHIIPHLIPPLVAYGTLLVAANVIVEAGASFLGFGIKLPTASWGSMLSVPWNAADSGANGGVPTSVPSFLRLTLVPSAAIFLTVLSLNQFGEGLREAFDPRGGTR